MKTYDYINRCFTSWTELGGYIADTHCAMFTFNRLHIPRNASEISITEIIIKQLILQCEMLS